MRQASKGPCFELIASIFCCKIVNCDSGEPIARLRWMVEDVEKGKGSEDDPNVEDDVSR